LDSLAIRFAVPLGGRPSYVGFEVSWEMPFGWISGTLLVGDGGQTIVQATGYLSIWGSGDPFTTTACVSALLAFVEPGSWLPIPAIGGGLGIRLALGGPWVDARAELLYPVAFSPPWITLGTGWSP
jgi:hypothetical protein